MCRDGFRAPCETEDCANEVTCRDRPRLCPSCWDGIWPDGIWGEDD